jgi:antiviral helicase SLH1
MDTAQSKWLSQLANMRAAIASLPKPDPDAVEYGKDLSLDDDDIVSISGGDDMWDLISEVSEEEYTSGELDGAPVPPASVRDHQEAFGKDWLREQCIGVANRNSGLDSHSLQEQVEAILASDGHGAPPFSVYAHY